MTPHVGVRVVIGAAPRWRDAVLAHRALDDHAGDIEPFYSLDDTAHSTLTSHSPRQPRHSGGLSENGPAGAGRSCCRMPVSWIRAHRHPLTTRVAAMWISRRRRAMPNNSRPRGGTAHSVRDVLVKRTRGTHCLVDNPVATRQVGSVSAMCALPSGSKFLA